MRRECAQCASHIAQGASHIAQGASHIAQGASHIAQGGSHIAHGASYIAQGATHIAWAAGDGIVHRTLSHVRRTSLILLGAEKSNLRCTIYEVRQIAQPSASFSHTTQISSGSFASRPFWSDANRVQGPTQIYLFPLVFVVT